MLIRIFGVTEWKVTVPNFNVVKKLQILEKEDSLVRIFSAGFIVVVLTTREREAIVLSTRNELQNREKC